MPRSETKPSGDGESQNIFFAQFAAQVGMPRKIDMFHFAAKRNVAEFTFISQGFFRRFSEISLFSAFRHLFYSNLEVLVSKYVNFIYNFLIYQF